MYASGQSLKRGDITKTMATGGKQSAGFTIIETLIVLAVSSFLAVGALLLVSGKQAKTEFQVSANNLKQQFEQIINETANGYYPGNGDFGCVSGAVKPTITGTKAQGTNSGCVFLGKALAVGIGDPSTPAESFTVYPLIALQYKPGTKTDAASFAEAGPIALSPGTSHNGGIVDHSVVYKTQNGLTLTSSKYNVAGGGTAGHSTYAVFAFADDLGQYAAGADGTISSSVQQLSLFAYDTGASWPGGTLTGKKVVDAIYDNNIASTDVASLQLCYIGSTQQSAQYTITGHGQLSVTLKIFSTANCT